MGFEPNPRRRAGVTINGRAGSGRLDTVPGCQLCEGKANGRWKRSGDVRELRQMLARTAMQYLKRMAKRRPSASERERRDTEI